MTSAGAAGALRADAARNRALVLDAAERLFAMRGLDVCMQQIADEAGVGIGTVFRRFVTKEDLVVAILHARMQDLLALVEHAVERSATEPWDAFADGFLGTTELHARHRGLMQSLTSIQVAQPVLDDVRAQLAAALRILVQRAIDAGELRDDVVAEDIPLLQCAISRTSCMPIAAAEPEAWRRACALLLDGMRADAARTPLAPQLPTFEQVRGCSS